MLKIIDGRFHGRMLTAHDNKSFTLFAILLSLTKATLPGHDIVIKDLIKAGAICRAMESAGTEVRKHFLCNLDHRYGEVDITALPHDFMV